MSPSHHLKVCVLTNASAGTAERLEGGGALGATLAAAFEAAGIEADIRACKGDGLQAAAEQARQDVLSGRFDAVVVGGGDGSIRTVASVLVNSDVPLGILPLGTLNHFAKDLGLPMDLDAAVAVIAGAKPVGVDVGDVNGKIFINNCSIGLYPYLVVERERQRRHSRLSKWAAMALALPRVLRNLPLFRLAVRMHNIREPCRSPCVFVGNNEYDLTLPALGKRKRLDRGELCIYVARAETRLGLFRIAIRTILGRFDAKRELRIFKTDSAEIVSRRHWLIVAFDGEVEAMRTPLRYRSRPAALLVFAPAQTD